ncbi:MAG: hypothetical protein V3V67_09755 [Myxococcota bacterium]
MSRGRSDCGFGLIAALFLLVVLSAAAAFMVNLSGVSRTTVNLSIYGSHAYRAARAGLEWGIYDIATNGTGTCFTPQTLSLTQGGFAGLDVDVTCTSTDHTEATTSSTVFQIVAISESGAYGDAEYARRRLRVTVTDAP